MSKRELIDALVEVLGEESWPELRRIVDKAIEAQRVRLSKLQQLSMKLDVGSFSVIGGDVKLSVSGEAKNGSVRTAILNIMKGAGKPLTNFEIRDRYLDLYRKEISSSLVGNILWREKGKLYKNDDNGKWTKWELIKEGKE